MFNNLINFRCTRLQNFERGAAIDVPAFSRWFVAVWLNTIFDGGIISEMATLETVRFIVTLGGIIGPTDVESFGLVRVTATPPLAACPVYK
jgi:hypothetical protein